ncbi:MAG TPA: hypothetical protein DDX98_01375, partial [Bacteroidales bacterium]|nr:hypothetical protein [Bacteroidales bacterium]
MKIPITLSYYTGGIRVDEEASWVGLGWSMTFGSIVQIINDQDDLKGGYTKLLPDYHFMIPPYEFVYYNYPLWFRTIGPSGQYVPSEGISQTSPQHSYIQYTDYFIPVDGHYGTRYPEIVDGSGWGYNNYYDSEPDIFKASFFGHDLKMTYDFKNDEIVVLNKKGYNVDVDIDQNTGKIQWTITDQNGIQYIFNVMEETKLEETYSIVSDQGYPGESGIVSGRVWRISKIIDNKGQEIVLEWSEGYEVKNFRSYSQSTKRYDFKSFHLARTWEGQEKADRQPVNFGDVTHNDFSVTRTSQKVPYLLSIEYNKGAIEFTTSFREDRLFDRKLDWIKVINLRGDEVKWFEFNYDYFVSADNSNGFDNTVYYLKTNDEKLKRLKLLSVKEIGSNPYEFYYDSETLPSKTSYATDYWGFYNGVLNNNSLVPNPTNINNSVFPDNGNDHRPNLNYAKACALKEMAFPTGGAVRYHYGFNVYSNRVGAGLRIDSISMHRRNGEKISTTKYTYEGGISFSPLDFSTLYSNSQPDEGYPPEQIGLHFYDLHEISSKSYFSPSLYSSGNLVGYSKVTIRKFDKKGNNNGKLVKYFANSEDIYSSIEYNLEPMSLPARQKVTQVKNGKLTRKEIFDSNDNKVRETIFNYENTISEVYYGARIGGSSLIYTGRGSFGNYERMTFEQNIVGYYPIYTKNSQLTSKEIRHYEGSGNYLSELHEYGYDDLELLRSHTITDNNDDSIKTVYHYVHNTTTYPIENGNLFDGILQDLKTENRLAYPTIIENYRNDQLINKKVSLYNDFAGRIELEKQLTIQGQEKFVEYNIDRYGPYGNIWQYALRDGIKNTIIWGYNWQYPLFSLRNA